MSKPILVIHDTTLQRITTSAALKALGLTAQSCASAGAAAHIISGTGARAIIADAQLLSDAGLQNALLSAPEIDGLIALVPEDTPHARLKALRAGADAVLATPIDAKLLGASLRQLRRTSDERADFLPNKDHAHALGFAEDPPPLVRPGTALVITNDRQLPLNLAALTRAEITHMDTAQPLQLTAPHPLDVVVLDRRHQIEDPEALFQMMAELRQQDRSQQMMQLIVLPPGQAELAAYALDMGASDVIMGHCSDAEIAHRAGRLLRRKHEREQFRTRIRKGLCAAVTDPLTGLPNRRLALSRLAYLSQTTEVLALCVLDIDHFKRVNDRYGHAVGDEVLRAFATRLKNMLPASAFCARLGGEEFLAVLPVRNADQAFAAAQLIAQKTRCHPIRMPDRDLAMTITVSIGLHVTAGPINTDRDASDLVEQADQALYRSKHAGRDCVTSTHFAA